MDHFLYQYFYRVINASAAVTLLEQRPEKNFRALSGIRTHDLYDAGAVLSHREER